MGKLRLLFRPITKQVVTPIGELRIGSWAAAEANRRSYDIIWNLAQELNEVAEQLETKRTSQLLHANILDHKTPTQLKLFRSQLELVEEVLREDQSVLIHCYGGCGRTGLVLALLLHRLGITKTREQALTMTHLICQGPETEQQKDFVRWWDMRSPKCTCEEEVPTWSKACQFCKGYP